MRSYPESKARIVQAARFVFAAMAAIMVAACAPNIIESEGPQRPARTVLVLTGAGMVSSTTQDPRYEAIWSGVASRYAGAFSEELNSTGPHAKLHVIKNREESPQTALVRLVKEEKKDAVVQVTVKHVRTSTVNTIYLEAEFMPLVYNRLSNGQRNVVPQSGTRRNYPMLSTTSQDMRDASIPDLAKQFVSELRGQGYLQ